MSATYIGSDDQRWDGVSTLSLVATSASPGNLLVVCIAFDPSSSYTHTAGTFTAPTGWSLETAIGTDGITVWSHFCGTSEPASYVWTVPDVCVGVLLEYSGIGVGASIRSGSGSGGSVGAQVETPSLLTNVDTVNGGFYVAFAVYYPTGTPDLSGTVSPLVRRIHAIGTFAELDGGDQPGLITLDGTYTGVRQFTLTGSSGTDEKYGLAVLYSTALPIVTTPLDWGWKIG